MNALSMNHNTRRGLLAAGALSVAIGLTACGGSATPNPEPSPTPSASRSADYNRNDYIPVSPVSFTVASATVSEYKRGQDFYAGDIEVTMATKAISGAGLDYDVFAYCEGNDGDSDVPLKQRTMLKIWDGVPEYAGGDVNEFPNSSLCSKDHLVTVNEADEVAEIYARTF